MTDVTHGAATCVRVPAASENRRRLSVPRCVARIRMTTLGIVAISLGAPELRAQDRLVGTRFLGAGASYESITFGGSGLTQAGFGGLDSARITGVRQFTTPVTFASPIGRGWRLDVTSLYSVGSVEYKDASGAGDSRSVSLSGFSDVRMRASGRVLQDGLIITIGANLPTGRTALTSTEFNTLRVLSSPALGLGSTPVGSGPSGTFGLVVPTQAAGWSVALGGSYEIRGRYQPIASLAAGSASAYFTPGGVMRASITGDRTLGPHRLTLAMAADVFTRDKLRSDVKSDVAGSPSTLNVATVQLGPVFSADAQMQLAVPAVREMLAYTSYRWRAPFARDGITVDRSSGHYVESGARASVALASGRDVVVSADARWHSGLGVDLGLPTSGVVSGAFSVGLNLRRNLAALQPYLRAEAGSLSQRSATGANPSRSFTGGSAGVVLSTRF